MNLTFRSSSKKVILFQHFPLLLPLFTLCSMLMLTQNAVQIKMLASIIQSKNNTSFIDIVGYAAWECENY